MKCRFLLLLAAVLLMVGCRRTPQSADAVVETQAASLQTRKLAEPGARTGKLFRLLSPDVTGIDLVHRFPDHAGADMLSDQNSGSGVCIGDVDGDGFPDVFFTNYDQGNRLYRNRGGLRFEDVTSVAGVAGAKQWCAGPSFVDIDNDGDLDLHVCVYSGKNLLYLNDGKGHFSEQAAQFGLDVDAASVTMSFADYDCDGDLDAYLVTHRLVTEGKKHRLPASARSAIRQGIIRPDREHGARVTPEYRDYFAVMPKGKPGRVALVIAGQEDILFRNERGRFRNVNREAGIQGQDIGLSAIWCDFDNNLRPDLYVSNDYKGADKLYRNNGDGTFTNIVESLCPHVPWYSMGADVGDVNNDGWTDLFASDMSGTSHYKQKMAMGDMSDDAWFLDLARPPQYMRNAMFLNTGGTRMLEIAKLAGIASTDWTWSPKFADMDNDGWLDLFVANGMSRDFMNSDLHQGRGHGGALWKNEPVLREQNLAFRNLDGLHFEDVSQRWGLDQLSASYGAAFADLDRDGDLDLIVTNFDDLVSVYENQSSNNRLLLKLIGTSSNRGALGTRVELRTSLGRQTRQLNSTQGFLSSNEPLIHFGLGDALVEQAIIYWPSGHVQTIEADELPPNHLIVVEEPTETQAAAERPTKLSRFHELSQFRNFQHRERQHDDFAVQPLLPSKKSQLGPGIACGDVDGDGHDDFYLGGAAGSAGALVLGKGRGAVRLPVGGERFEDMGAVFFDADSDGDLDLYVVSGGGESEVGSETLRDRLYLQANEGFELATDALPDVRDAGSCVCAADFDRDGDLDLFVGGYSLPGRYPESATSRLLRNNGGRFSDVTNEVMQTMTSLKLVTSAIWSDVNGDQWLDLLVAQEWGPVTVFLNQNGRLTQSRSTGIEDRHGWWGGIACGDVDGDGDLDYVVGNQGLNSKYHASADQPARLFRGDFDGSGRQRLVEAKYESGILLPERGKSCSTAAMPILAEKFSTYQAFAMAGLEEIYSQQLLDSAENLFANTLESCVLVNDGTGRFTVERLPPLAQLAPIDGVALSHFDHDGVLDLVVAQNDFSPQRETGRMDGGVSLFLRGLGSGKFAAEWPNESGISVIGDAQCLAIVDLNDDQRPDLLFGVNDRPWRSFALSAGNENVMTVALQGPVGNPSGAGARVEVHTKENQIFVQEVIAGAGYLTQSSAKLFFATDPKTVDSVHVHWPDGLRTVSREISRRTIVAYPQQVVRRLDTTR